MKRIAAILTLIILSISAFAQSAEEIVSRMEKNLEGAVTKGIAMTADVKVPIIGTMTTTTYSLGDKLRIEGEVGGVKVITWSDSRTTWIYDGKNKRITIDDSPAANAESTNDEDLDLFMGITDGYDVSIRKEDATAWYISCKKSKDFKDKNAPKSIDLVVRKGNYLPISLATTLSGVKMTLRNISVGVSEKSVTFNADDFPGVPIEDKRK